MCHGRALTSYRGKSSPHRWLGNSFQTFLVPTSLAARCSSLARELSSLPCRSGSLCCATRRTAHERARPPYWSVRYGNTTWTNYIHTCDFNYNVELSRSPICPFPLTTKRKNISIYNEQIFVGLYCCNKRTLNLFYIVNMFKSLIQSKRAIMCYKFATFKQ